MFNTELKDKIRRTFRFKRNSDCELNLSDDELGQIQMIMERVAEAYDCSTSSGFTWQEAAIAEMLETLYDCAFEDGRRFERRQNKYHFDI